MIHTAKAIAANGQSIVHFANHIGEQCTDKRYVTIIMMVWYEKGCFICRVIKQRQHT